MIISLISTKGGTGKTTSTIFLATALVRAGHTVDVIDLDPQASASQWAVRATENEDPLPFTVSYVDTKTLSTQLAASTADIVLIDTPPGHAQAIQAAINVSDFAIVLSQPTPMDLQQLWALRPALTASKWAVLVTRAQIGTRLLGETEEALDTQGVARFKNAIYQRQAIASEYGYTPSELHAYPLVADELLQHLN